MAQWLGICLPAQGTHSGLRSLVGEESTHLEATKSVCHNYGSLCTSSLGSETRDATAVSSLGAATTTSPHSSQLETAWERQ